MQDLISPELLTSFVGGTVLTVIVGALRSIFKKKEVKLSSEATQGIVLLLAVLLGVGYTAFRSFLPVELQESIVNFGMQSLTWCVFIYEFLWKNLKRLLFSDTK